MATKTRGDEIIEVCDDTLAGLGKLKFGPYSSADISKLIEPLASRVELFLKAVVFPGSSNRANFHALIENLRPTGLATQRIDDLHALRELYNLSKHQPGADLDLASATNIAASARATLEAIDAAGLGMTKAALDREVKYHLWVGFWDSYTGGFTEIAIMLPGIHWTHVSSVDMMYIKITDWDALKATLSTHPRFHLGKENFSAEVWQSFHAEGDFLNAGVWDGDYAELIGILAKYAYREIEDKLLPGLPRKDNYISIGTSVISAALDVARTAASPMSGSELAKKTLARADGEYAVSAESERARKAADQIAAIVMQVSFGEWTWLAGPFLALRRERPDNELPSAPGPLDVVMREGSLILRFSDAISISVMKLD
jgi:hypothetical protein